MNWKWFRRFQAALFAAVILSGTAIESRSQEALSPKGPVILTIAGEISKSNRGQAREKRDAFLSYHEIKFDRAFQLDQAMLDQLKQGTVRVNAPQTEGPVTLKGALLSEVLGLVGAKQGISLRTVALDGFSTEVSPEKIAAHDWILASTQDGKPLNIGGQGPLWMVYKPSKIDVPEKEEQEWPWALFFIEVTK